MTCTDYERFKKAAELLPESYEEMGLRYVLFGELPSSFMLDLLIQPYHYHLGLLKSKRPVLRQWGEWLQRIPALCCGHPDVVESWIRFGGIVGFRELDVKRARGEVLSYRVGAK